VEELRKTTKYFIQNTPGSDPFKSRAHTDYKLEAVLFQPTCSVMVITEQRKKERKKKKESRKGKGETCRKEGERKERIKGRTRRRNEGEKKERLGIQRKV
jgi:hypothetical protein